MSADSDDLRYAQKLAAIKAGKVPSQTYAPVAIEAVIHSAPDSVEARYQAKVAARRSAASSPKAEEPKEEPAATGEAKAKPEPKAEEQRSNRR